MRVILLVFIIFGYIPWPLRWPPGAFEPDEPNEPDEDEEEQIICPRCKSKKWLCWDERDHYFHHKDKPHEIFQLPVGYLTCRDCDHDWLNYPIPVNDTDYVELGEDNGR